MKNTPAPNSLLLEVHVPNFNTVKDFYGRIGFEVVRERQPSSLLTYKHSF